MRLPANCAHPERRASKIRLAIRRVCQATAAETTILTEQTESTDRRQPPPTITQQIFCAWICQQPGRPNQRAKRPPHCAGPLKIVAQGGQLGSRGFAPVSACMCGPGGESSSEKWEGGQGFFSHL